MRAYKAYILFDIQPPAPAMTTRRSDDPLDTHLLRIFCLLIAERSVSRTALKLNQTQPAVSLALKRLRGILGDPLLVREKSGMVPTERALTLLAHARGALAEIDRMTLAPERFEPLTSRAEFRIGAPDYLAPVFMASVIERIRREAPGVRLTLQSLGPQFDFERSLAEGDLDVVIGNWPEPPPNLHIASLLVDDIVCLMSADHPLARGPITVEQYLRAPHVVPLPFSSTHRGVIDRHLASLRLTRNARVVVPFFSMAPYMLPSTDLIFTISRHFAMSYAGLLPLAVLPCPIDFPPMQFYQIWHARNHQAASHRWMRGLLKSVADTTIAHAAKPSRRRAPEPS